MGMTIPNVIPPFKDELLYSYILRLADANGFDDISLFLKFYVNDQKGLRNPTIKYNSEEPLNGLVKYLHPVLNPDGSETDFLNFYLDHSMARFYHGYVHPINVKDIIRNQFVNDDFTNMRMRYGRRNRPALNFCPECMAEDKDRHGTFYIHRIHQSTYAHLCPIHGCRLLYYAGPPGEELNEKIKLKETTLEECSYSRIYTKMCYEMFDCNRNLDYWFDFFGRYFANSYDNWKRMNQFSDRFKHKWIQPAQAQLKTISGTPVLERYILFLLYEYVRGGKNLKKVLSKIDTQISEIQRRIDFITACE